MPAGVPMDSRYLDSLKSFIGDEASSVESTEEKEAAEEEEVRLAGPPHPQPLQASASASASSDPNSKRTLT